MKYSLLLNKAYHEWPNQFITETELKKLGNIGAGEELFLTTQGADERITDQNPVDLGRFGVEQIYTAKAEKYQFIINETLRISHEPFVTETELRAVGKIPPDDDLYFKEEGADRKLTASEKIDLKPFPIEEFYSKERSKLVSITIDNKSYKVQPGKYSVDELKKIGHVDAAYALAELINGKLVELATGAVVVIKGSEEFKSYAKGGSSS